ncbi:unnamed protein product [Meganyctiphanes norvegica]|uniref:Uncharacterized protein n=1 Tax=Meganyctiphanes norvegica TaxID=48144 RepID=A0AAV2QM54_MEGNR
MIPTPLSLQKSVSREEGAKASTSKQTGATSSAVITLADDPPVVPVSRSHTPPPPPPPTPEPRSLEMGVVSSSSSSSSSPSPLSSPPSDNTSGVKKKMGM